MFADVGTILEEHYKLFQQPILKVGELHQQILRSVESVENQKRKDKEFVIEIGRDEIHWWVFYKETNPKELKIRTKEALVGLQKIKEDSVKLRDSLQPKHYSELIEGIKNFCMDHQTEIQTLLDYVIWLNKKDPCAPSILFTYRVWGSTRMGDRTITTHNRNEMDVIKALVEIALGLRNPYHGLTVVRVFSEIIYDIFESAYPEDYSKPITISEETVVTRASQEILREMSEYFEFLRNSLRNILLEIDAYEKSMHLIHNDGFWRSFIYKVIQNPIERHLWDFKETLAMWEMSGEMKRKKEFEFCEDVACFANNEGGVLIVGITDGIPRKIVGINDLENRVKSAKDSIRKRTDYPKDFTYFHPLVLKDENNVERACLLIVIKRTEGVVGVKREQGSFTYPFRSETGITRLTHDKIFRMKIALKHDDYEFLSALETSYST